MPWAKLSSRYEFANRLLILLNILEMIFESQFLLRFRFYIAILPSTVITLFLVVYSSQQLKYYSKWVEFTHLVKDIVLLNFFIYAISVDLINEKVRDNQSPSAQIDEFNYEPSGMSLSDITYIIMIIVSCFIMSSLFILRRLKSFTIDFEIEQLKNYHLTKSINQLKLEEQELEEASKEVLQTVNLNQNQQSDASESVINSTDLQMNRIQDLSQLSFHKTEETPKSNITKQDQIENSLDIKLQLKRDQSFLKDKKYHQSWELYALLQLIDINMEKGYQEQGMDVELKLDKMLQQHKSICSNLKCVCLAYYEKSETTIDDDNQTPFNYLMDKIRNSVKKSPKISELIQTKEDQSLIIKNEQEQRSLRNEILVKIFTKKLKSQSQINKKQIKYLEIFISTFYFNRTYSSYYKLLKIKQFMKNQNNSDKLNLFYLKNQIIQAVNKNEKQLKKEVIDVDNLIQTDKSFMEYKKLLYETSLLVERFWSALNKNDFEIIQIIKVGRQIVDQYLETKNLYDEIIDIKPDFKEIVQLQMTLNIDVMNFEIEGLNLQTLLKNIQQKLSIAKHSVYQKSKDQIGLILISGNPDNKGKILLVNEVICNSLDMKLGDLIDININQIMPRVIGATHDELIEQFLTKNHHRQMKITLTRVWLKKFNQCIIPCKIDVQINLSERHGIILSGQISFDEELKIGSVTCKIKDSFLLITDDYGYLENVSENFINRFMPNEQFAIDDFKINAEEIIHFSDNNLSESELNKGVQGKFLGFLIEGRNSTNEYSETNVLVLVNKFKLPKNNGLREYVFVEIENEERKDSTTQKSTIGVHNIFHNSSHNYFEQDELILMNEANTSSESGSSKSTEIINLKGTIDFKQTPKSLSNLQKAILLFFLILIGTSFSVLVVTQVQNNQFSSDSQIVKESIKLNGYLAHLRVAFRTLLLYPSNQTVGQVFDFDYLQDQLEIFYDSLQNSAQITLQDENYVSTDLKNAMSSNAINLRELQQDGSITTVSTTFSLALQQFLSKIQKFVTVDKQSFSIEFKNFLLRTIPKNPTDNQRDAYFIIINGMYDIRSFSLELFQLFINQAQSQEDNHKTIVLIITMSCISVTLLSSLCLIPVTFALDAEQENIVKQWMMVSQNTKKDILAKVDEFTHQLLKDKKKDLKKKHIHKNTNKNVHRLQQASDDSLIKPYDALNNPKNIMSFFSLEGPLSVYQLNDSIINSTQKDFINYNQHLDKLEKQTSKINLPSQNIEISYSRSRNQTENIELRDIQLQQVINSENSNQQSIIAQQKSIQIKQDVEETKLNQNQSEVQTIQDVKQNRKVQKQRLMGLYRFYKIQKALLILIFASIIIGFYLGFYFLSQKVFITANDSFDFLNNFNSRTPCLSNLYQMLDETFAQNQTLLIGFQNQTLINRAQQGCQIYEDNIQGYMSSNPPQLQSIQSFLNSINSDQVCQISFSNDSSQINYCQTVMNGIMMNGLSNTFNSLYYYLYQELISFNSYQGQAWLRTTNYLNTHLYKLETLNSIDLFFQCIIPITEYLNSQVDAALKAYLNTQINNFILVFVFFSLFLIVSLYLSLGKLINFLKRDLFRSRILVKIIPASELQEIQRKLRRKKSKKSQKNKK